METRDDVLTAIAGFALSANTMEACQAAPDERLRTFLADLREGERLAKRHGGRLGALWASDRPAAAPAARGGIVSPGLGRQSA